MLPDHEEITLEAKKGHFLKKEKKAADFLTAVKQVLPLAETGTINNE